MSGERAEDPPCPPSQGGKRAWMPSGRSLRVAWSETWVSTICVESVEWGFCMCFASVCGLMICVNCSVAALKDPKISVIDSMDIDIERFGRSVCRGRVGSWWAVGLCSRLLQCLCIVTRMLVLEFVCCRLSAVSVGR